MGVVNRYISGNGQVDRFETAKQVARGCRRSYVAMAGDVPTETFVAVVNAASETALAIALQSPRALRGRARSNERQIQARLSGECQVGVYQSRSHPPPSKETVGLGDYHTRVLLLLPIVVQRQGEREGVVPRGARPGAAMDKAIVVL